MYHAPNDARLQKMIEALRPHAPEKILVTERVHFQGES